jgi:cell division control protein 6
VTLFYHREQEEEEEEADARLVTIFKDREKLSPRYVPPNLLHRERQIDDLTSFFRDSMVDPSRSFLKPIQIVGPAGTGKTSTVLRFGERFVSEARKNKGSAQHVYVNLKLQGGSRVILYRHLLEKATPEVYSSSLSAEEMLRAMLRRLKETSRYLLLSLDEVDYFIKSTRETRIIYDLTRLNEVDPESGCNVVGVIFVSRNKDFHERLDRAELSALGRITIEFPPYRHEEIVDILAQRAADAFNPGTVSEEVLQYVADMTASPPIGGDVRYALDTLLYAGTLAENQNSDRVLIDHVRTIYAEVHPSITEEDIMDLPKKEHLITLLAVAKSLTGGDAPYVTLKDIRLNAKIVCEERRMKPIDDIDEYVQDLSDRGLVEIRSLKEIGIIGAPGENLESYLDRLLKRISDGLDGH